MPLYKSIGRRGVYPMTRLLNDFIQNKNLYVTEIVHHVHAPAEYLCKNSKGYNIHIILKGKVSVNGRTLSAGDGFFHHHTSYDIKKVCDEDYEESTITFNGFTARQFAKETLGFSNNFVFFKLNEKTDIMFLKNTVFTDFTNINLDMYMLSKLYLLASYIMPPITNIAASYVPEPSNDLTTNKHLLKAFEYVAAHYSETITVNELAEFLHLSPNYMCSLFKTAIELTPQQYIIRYKIQIACNLISCTKSSIGQIAALVGYNDPKHFSQVFKSIVHFSPTEYRKKTTERDI